LPLANADGVDEQVELVERASVALTCFLQAIPLSNDGALRVFSRCHPSVAGIGPGQFEQR
jgi:hypothetical protein